MRKNMSRQEGRGAGRDNSSLGNTEPGHRNAPRKKSSSLLPEGLGRELAGGSVSDDKIMSLTNHLVAKSMTKLPRGASWLGGGKRGGEDR